MSLVTGKLGSASLAAATYTTVYRVPSSGVAMSSANIRVTNLSNSSSVGIRLAVCPSSYVDGATPASADYIEPQDLQLPGGAVLEETGLVLSPGEAVVAYASTAQVSVRVHGFEE